METYEETYWMHVFSLLQIKDLMRCEMVSKTWNNVVQEPGIWLDIFSRFRRTQGLSVPPPDPSVATKSECLRLFGIVKCPSCKTTNLMSSENNVARIQDKTSTTENASGMDSDASSSHSDSSSSRVDPFFEEMQQAAFGGIDYCQGCGMFLTSADADPSLSNSSSQKRQRTASHEAYLLQQMTRDNFLARTQRRRQSRGGHRGRGGGRRPRSRRGR
eukprot:GILK01013264.1.p1 GENE.GILK01013264.1~~GILK01013264.1.p1  ORF type:complete len:224 (+),score=19.17 GILK01013264.1:26-673(+)